MVPCSFYPKFEENQVLTAKQLNDLTSYLETTERLTRAKAIGIGIICGLELALVPGTPLQLILSQGVGISSEGYLIKIEKYAATRFLKYDDPADYDPFWPDGEQIDLWELLSDADFKEGDGSQALSVNFLQDKAVILYLECDEIDLKTCTGDDCDEQGIRIELCVKKLLIAKSDLENIIAAGHGLQIGSNLDKYFNARYDLPEIKIDREAALLQLGGSIKHQDLIQFYLKLIKPFWTPLADAYALSYAAYRDILADRFNANPFIRGQLKLLFKDIAGKHHSHIQYVYDHLKDLSLAYEEFKTTAFELTAWCCPPAGLFPKHLMLGPATGSVACRPSIYRQGFIPAYVCREHDQRLKKARSLFERMTLLVDYFQIPPGVKNQIKITPSQEKETPLSLRAIPYYYKTGSTLLNFWSYEKYQKCQSDHILSFHAAKWAPTHLPFVLEPLAFNYDSYPFFRIEGHIGGKYSRVLMDLDDLIEKYNLPIKVIGLSLEGKPSLKTAEAVKVDNTRARLDLALGLMKLSPVEFDRFVRGEKISGWPLLADRTILDFAAELTPKHPVGMAPRAAGGSDTTPEDEQPVSEANHDLVDDQVCGFDDLEAIYISLKSGLICLLQKSVDFFTGLKIGTKPPAYQPGGSGVMGSVFDALGKPMTGAEILIIDSRFNKAIKNVKSDQNGTFTIPDIDSGDYYMIVNHKNLEVMRDVVRVEDGKTLVTDVRFDVDPEALEKASRGGYSFEGAGMSAAKMSGLSVKTKKSPGNPAKTPGNPVHLMGESRILSYRLPQSAMFVTGNLFLAQSLAKPAPKNTVGEYLKEARTFDRRADSLDFSYEYFAKYPYLVRKDIPASFAREIQAPVNLIEKIKALVETLAETLQVFDLELFEKSHQVLVTTARVYKKAVIDDLKEPETKPRGDEQDIIDHLNLLIEDCSLAKFQSLLAIYHQRLLEVQKLTRFSDFAKLHPGLEHLAGVPKGGTFIVVYDETNTVIADFALPYICCSDCPPITTVCTSTPVVFKLPNTRFCTDDETEYKFMLGPPGGLVAGPGVRRDNATGDYYFLPSHSEVTEKQATFNYKVDDLSAQLAVDMIDVKAQIDHQIIKLDQVKKMARVKFIAAPLEADSYAWELGDGTVADKQSVEHEYDISANDTFQVKLAVSKDDCTSRDELTLDLVECSAEFSYRIDMQDSKKAKVSFTVAHQDQETYVWNFGDGKTSEDKNPTHEFSLVETLSFTVALSVIKGECEDSQEKPLNFSVCTANFNHTVVKHSGQSATVQFTPAMTDAEKYRWDFGDNSASAEPSPIHTFDLSEKQTFKVKLSVDKGACHDARQKDILLEACTADFSHKVTSQSPISATVKFTPVMQEGDHFWTFDDGATSTTTSPQHTYKQTDKSYLVKLKATRGTCTDTHTEKISFAPCTAAFDYNISKIDAKSATVEFKARLRRADAYEWLFGDGNTAVTPNPINIFDISETRSYKVTLKVVKGPCEDLGQEEINFQICTAAFSHTVLANDGKIATVQFKADMRDAVRYKWSTSDGQVSEKRDPQIVFKVTEVQKFDVTLIVQGTTCTDKKTQAIELKDCTAAFTHKVVEKDEKTATVQFTATMQNAGAYKWDFGDGMGSEEPNPAHKYDIRERKSFEVILFVRTETCQDRQARKITVA